jgi:hypothetical protein
MPAHLVVPPRIPNSPRVKLAAALALVAGIPALMSWSVAQRCDSPALDATRAPCHARASSTADAPGDVVRAQVTALGLNDQLGEDRGIRFAWRMASPANRAYTGPFPRFATMVRSPLYAPLLHHDDARFGPVDVNGDVATQRVVVLRDDVWLAYRFIVTRDAQGSWRTDSVLPVALE